MSSHPTISIVTATHNRRHLLAETIASVQAQTFADWEMLVIDDASTDETWPYLRQLADSRFTTFRLEQHGERSTARNLGLEAATGEYILFLDDDDLLEKAALQKHLDALRKYPGAVGTVGGYTMFDENNMRQTTRYVRRHRLHDIWPDLLFGHIPVFGQCLFRTELIKSAGGWDGEFIPIEDHQFWLRLAASGKVVLLPDRVLHYRIHSGQWRPRKLWKLMTKVRERAIKRLTGEARESADRILAAREQYRQAENHYYGGETLQAARRYLNAVRLMPPLLRSPLTRPMILSPLLKCLFGGQPVFLQWLRVTGQKQIDTSRCMIIDEYGENHRPVSGQRDDRPLTEMTMPN